MRLGIWLSGWIGWIGDVNGLDRLINYMDGKWVVRRYGEVEGYNNYETMLNYFNIYVIYNLVMPKYVLIICVYAYVKNFVMWKCFLYWKNHKTNNNKNE